MNFRHSALIVLIAVIMSLVSCKDDNPEHPRIELKFRTITSPFSLKSTQQTRELSFNSGYIILTEIEFTVENDDDSVEVSFNLEIEANTTIDFATGETTPDISYIEIPAGTYNEMEVEIELEDEGDTPSVVLNGTYIDAGAVDHDIRFEFNSGETFEIEKEGTITFAADESVIAQITIDPTAWFNGVSNEQLSSATKDNNGVIVISETQNPDIFDAVADGLDIAAEIEIGN